jgi:hypothetical protein
VDDWRKSVYASSDPNMTGAVKVLCLYLADHMRLDNRHVSIPRKQIAKALGVHEQRIAERYRKAVTAQFLTPVSPGYVGHTAVYQGTWPDAPALECVPLRSTHSDGREARERTDSRDTLRPPGAVHTPTAMRTALLDAISRADLFATTRRRNVGTYEGRRRARRLQPSFGSAA